MATISCLFVTKFHAKTKTCKFNTSDRGGQDMVNMDKLSIHIIGSPNCSSIVLRRIIYLDLLGGWGNWLSLIILKKSRFRIKFKKVVIIYKAQLCGFRPDKTRSARFLNGFKSTLGRACVNGKLPFCERCHSRPQRPRSFWSAPRIPTSGPVQRHSVFEWLCKHNRLRSQPIRFVRPDSEHAQSDGKSVNRGLPVLDMARGRDSWCWPKGARPLGTRMERCKFKGTQSRFRACARFWFLDSPLRIQRCGNGGIELS